MLQVGIGHKADNGIERQSRLHPLYPIGIKKRDALDTQNYVTDKDHHRVGTDKSHGVLFPIHALLLIYRRFCKSRRLLGQTPDRRRCVFLRRYDIDTAPPE